MVNLVFIALIVILIALGFAGGGAMAQAAVSSSTGGGTVPTDSSFNPNNAPSVPQHIVPSNPSTWPSGDRIWDCCRAIAYAEGYNVAGSNPATLNNPGDISDGATTYGFETHAGSNITKFPDAATGWRWLWSKLNNAATGNSSVYDPSMSWNEIGALWAPPNAGVWASNVAGALGVDPDSSLGDYVGA